MKSRTILSAKLAFTPKSVWYACSFIPSLLVIVGNLLGGFYTVSNIIFSLVGLVIADWLVAVDNQNNEVQSKTLPEALLIMAVWLHTICIYTLLYGVYEGNITGNWVWFAAVSTGLNAGALGITAAHELIHKREKWKQLFGIWNLFLTNYCHFYIEHRFNHHLKVGTLEDPATSQFNENFYAFLIRTIPSQWYSSLQIEAKKLKKSEKFPYSFKNFVIRSTSLEVVYMILLYFWLGPLAFGAYFIQSLVAIILLEYVNYIEHYGLVRSKGEKVDVHHSWQSDTISSRFMLFELLRHSDHHLKASKPYYSLDSHQEAYILPSGYFGMFYIALIPPLWFRMVNPIITRRNTS